MHPTNSPKVKMGKGQVPRSQHVPPSVHHLHEELRNAALEHWALIAADIKQKNRAYHGFDSGTDYDFNNGENGKVRFNALRNIVKTFSSRALEDRRKNTIWPRHARDVMAAETYRVVQDYYRHRLRLDRMDYEFMTRLQLDGTAGFKTWWDVDRGDELLVPEQDEEGVVVRDPLTRAPKFKSLGPEGEPNCKIVSALEFHYGPDADFDDAEYCTFRTFVSESTARHLMSKSEYEHDEDPAPSDYERLNGRKAKGYEVWEHWYLPCPRIPDGCFMKFVGGCLVQYRDFYPDEDRLLPLSVAHFDAVPDAPYGTSHVDDNIHLQRRLNHLEAKKDELVDNMAILLMTHQRIADQIKDGERRIVEVASPDEANMTRYLLPPAIDGAVTSRAQEVYRQMFDTAGVNEVLAGAENPSANSSAKLMAFLKRTDSQKLAGPVLNFDYATLGRDRKILSLTQTKVKNERVVHILGDDNQMKMAAFRGADLEGLDLILEPGPGTDAFRQAAAADVEDKGARGMVDPASAMERASTGLGETMGEQGYRNKMQDILAAAMDGMGHIEPDPSVPPVIALQEIQKARGLEGANQAALDRLEQFYRQQASAMSRKQAEQVGQKDSQ